MIDEYEAAELRHDERRERRRFRDETRALFAGDVLDDDAAGEAAEGDHDEN